MRHPSPAVLRTVLRLATNRSAFCLVLVAGTALAPSVAGQSAVWQPQGATTGNIYYNRGNVGIGTCTGKPP